jgi:nucleoside-diphosphate-sugar epimerase
MRVLVTGHLSYIGAVLTPMLVRTGHEVIGLDSDLYSRSTYSAGASLFVDGERACSVLCVSGILG